MAVGGKPDRIPSRLLIVAAAGYGKSTALDAACPPGGVLGTATDLRLSRPPDPPFVGVDDFDRISAEEQLGLAAQLGRLPATTVLMLAAREPVAPEVVSALGGQAFRRGPADLALNEYDVARVLNEEYATSDAEAAPAVAAITGGWPALVHFAGDRLRRGSIAELCTDLSQPGSACAEWIAARVTATIPAWARLLLGALARIGPITPAAAAVLDEEAAPDEKRALDEQRDSAALIAELTEIGALIDGPGLRSPAHKVVVPLVAACLTRDSAPLAPAVLARIAQAHHGDGLWRAALRAWVMADDRAAVVRLAVDQGRSLARGGNPSEVADLLAGIGDADVVLVRAEALRLAGATEEGRRLLRPLAGVADDTPLATRVATSLAGCLYTEGDHRAALAVLNRAGGDGDRGARVDQIEWLAARTQVLSMLGDRESARQLAVETLRKAERDDDPWSLSAAHLASSRVSSGTRRELHLDRALRYATAAGDIATAAVVRVNQTHLLLASARFADAVEVGRDAVRLCALSSGSGRLAAALHNLGEALMRVGEFDEAAWQYRRGAAAARRLGAGRAGLGLLGTAEIHREVGQREQARSDYREAVELASATGELQVLVPALAGLSRVQAGLGDDRAAETARRAADLATPALRPFACLGEGWVALALDQREQAREAAARAVRESREQGAADLLAESLELSAAAETDPERARDALREALAIWSAGGAVPARARVQVALGRTEGADATVRASAHEATDVLRRLGVRESGSPVGPGGQVVRVRVLGRFQVSVQGRVVPLARWRSRQARTLLKVLVAHRGRPVSRERLCELLWPDDDPARTPHRLSVLLSTVRGVLDPDKAWPAERFIASDRRGLWLDLDAVSIDVEDYLVDAAQAADLLAAGDREAALQVLVDLDKRHRGPALEDEEDELWADPLREEVRVARLRSLRRLATALASAGRAAEAQDVLARLLTIDPYDEQIHRLLVRSLAKSGRHGEAERAYERWRDAMRAIGAPLPVRELVLPGPDSH